MRLYQVKAKNIFEKIMYVSSSIVYTEMFVRISCECDPSWIDLIGYPYAYYLFFSVNVKGCMWHAIWEILVIPIWHQSVRVYHASGEFILCNHDTYSKKVLG